MRVPTPDQTMSAPANDTENDIEQLIYDIAEHARDQDFTQLYQSLAGRELFIPIEKDSLSAIPQHIKPGEPFQVEGDASIQLRNVEGPRGEAFVPVVTTENAPIVKGSSFGIYWPDALKMVLKIEGVAGLLLKGENSSIYFYKPQIENILKQYG